MKNRLEELRKQRGLSEKNDIAQKQNNFMREMCGFQRMEKFLISDKIFILSTEACKQFFLPILR